MNAMNELAPESMAEDWDNVGLLIGDENAEIKKVLVALDATEEVVVEATCSGVDLIITHHPFIFGSLRRITANDPLGRRIMMLVHSSVNLYSAHTNLDMAVGGVNDVLAECLGLTEVENLCPPVDEHGKFSLGRVGLLDRDYELLEFCELVKDKLELDCAEVYGLTGSGGKKIRKVAVLGGSGGEAKYFRQAILKNCDVLITGDIKYHNAQAAIDMGLCLIDATHYATENLVCAKIKSYLESRFDDLEIIETRTKGQIVNFI